MTNDKEIYLRKSFSVTVKIKPTKEAWRLEFVTYPSSNYNEETMSVEDYVKDIFPKEHLMIKGKHINCKDLEKAIMRTISTYMDEHSK